MRNKSRHLAGSLLLGAAIVVALGACSPNVRNRGNLLDDEQVTSVRPGESTRQQVIENLGSPSVVNAFNENVWYYIGQRTEHWAFFRPEVTEHRVLAVSFNDQGIVSDVRTVGIEETREVEVVERTTPTRGREPSLVQSLYQLLITGPVQTLDRGRIGAGGLDE